MKNPNLNCPVSITAIGFEKGMKAYPKRMEWQGKTYHFLTRGLRLNVRRGESLMSTTVTCSDGKNDFCLRQRGGTWTLVSVG